MLYNYNVFRFVCECGGLRRPISKWNKVRKPCLKAA